MASRSTVPAWAPMGAHGPARAGPGRQQSEKPASTIELAVSFCKRGHVWQQDVGLCSLTVRILLATPAAAQLRDRGGLPFISASLTEYASDQIVGLLLLPTWTCGGSRRAHPNARSTVLQGPCCNDKLGNGAAADEGNAISVASYRACAFDVMSARCTLTMPDGCLHWTPQATANRRCPLTAHAQAMSDVYVFAPWCVHMVWCASMLDSTCTCALHLCA